MIDSNSPTLDFLFSNTDYGETYVPVLKLAMYNSILIAFAMAQDWDMDRVTAFLHPTL